MAEQPVLKNLVIGASPFFSKNVDKLCSLDFKNYNAVKSYKNFKYPTMDWSEFENHLTSKEKWDHYIETMLASEDVEVGPKELILHSINVGLVPESIFETFSDSDPKFEKTIQDLYFEFQKTAPSLVSFRQRNLKFIILYNRSFSKSSLLNQSSKNESDSKNESELDLRMLFALFFNYCADSGSINYNLIHGLTLPHLNQLMTVGDFDKDFIVYHGVKSFQHLKDKDGNMMKEITFRGYVSTFLMSTKALSFCNQIPESALIVLYIPKDTPFLNIGEEGNEILFPHGLKCNFQKLSTLDLFRFHHNTTQKLLNHTVIHYSVSL